MKFVGEKVAEMKLVKITLKGCTKQWAIFVTCNVAKDKFPDSARLWGDFTQKEIWEEPITSGQ